MSNTEFEDKTYIDEECVCGHLKSQHALKEPVGEQYCHACIRRDGGCKGFVFAHKILRKPTEQLLAEMDIIDARLKDMEAEGKRIVKPFEDEIERLQLEKMEATTALNKEYEKFKFERYRLSGLFDATCAIELREKWDNRMPKTSEEFGEWFRFSNQNPFYELGADVSRYFVTAINRTPKVEGLTILGGSDASRKYYVAFDANGRIVANLRIYNPQFRGDNTLADAIVDGQSIIFERTHGGYGDSKPVETWVNALKARGKVTK